MQTIQVNGKEVKYRLRRGNSRKYVILKFLPEERLEIILPKNCVIDVEALLKKKSSLIERKYRELANRQKILDGNMLLFKGKQRQIEVLENEQPPKNRVTVQGDQILVIIKEGEDAATLLKDWLTQKTEQYVLRTLQRYLNIFNTKPTEVKIKNTRRWGYCTSRRSLVFNWQLVALPKEVAEYVVLHEYAHLTEFNHQKAFHKIMANVCPEYRKREKGLKKFIPIAHLSFP